MILYPLQCCIYYLFTVYFARRNRLVPLIVAILIVGGYLPPCWHDSFCCPSCSSSLTG